MANEPLWLDVTVAVEGRPRWVNYSKDRGSYQ